MSALVLQQAISILPVKKERIEMPTYKVYSKKFEIAKFEELSNFEWKETSIEDEVVCEFADRTEAKILYRALRDLKLISYVSFL